MPVSVLVDDRELTIGLGSFKADLADRTSLLRIAGELMRASIARTFREQGSPAGSWPALAPSTMKRPGYGPGHKLLILSGRLFGSITYTVADGILTIGTNLVYAAVQMFGSKDRGGVFGPRTEEMEAATVKVGAYDYLRTIAFKKYGKRESVDSRGRRSSRRVRLQGPANASKVHMGAHERHQNIPARRYLVFRPEDPGRIMTAFDSYIRGRAVAIGTVGA